MPDEVELTLVWPEGYSFEPFGHGLFVVRKTGKACRLNGATTKGLPVCFRESQQEDARQYAWTHANAGLEADQEVPGWHFGN